MSANNQPNKTYQPKTCPPRKCTMLLQGTNINLSKVVAMRIGIDDSFGYNIYYLKVIYCNSTDRISSAEKYFKLFETEDEDEKEEFDALYDFYYKITRQDNVITFLNNDQIINLDFSTVIDVSADSNRLIISYENLSPVIYQYTEDAIPIRILYYFNEYKCPTEKEVYNEYLVEFSNNDTIETIDLNDIKAMRLGLVNELKDIQFHRTNMGPYYLRIYYLKVIYDEGSHYYYSDDSCYFKGVYEAYCQKQIQPQNDKAHIQIF